MKEIYKFISKKELLNKVKEALDEDTKKGDITSNLIFKDKEYAKFSLISKNNGILCGTEIFTVVFKQIDKNIKVKWFKEDGDFIKKNEKIAEIEGKIKSVLKGERVALNFLSHLTGIATQTYELKKRAGNLIIKDTRKTIPLLRKIQKYAVYIGGGKNHRMSLSDGIMIKDNHKKLKGLKNILEIIRKKKLEKKVILEVENLKEFELAIKYGISYIMLDNMKIEDIKKAAKLAGKKVFLEASGNINFENIKRYKNLGIKAVSCGFLTHSVKSFDFSLEAEEVI